MTSFREKLYREAESFVSHLPTIKHQCTRLGSVSNGVYMHSVPHLEPYMPEHVFCWCGLGFESHSQPFLLTCPEADFAFDVSSSVFIL